MAKKEIPSRFVEVYSQKTPGITKVLVDLATGVNYLYHSEHDNYGGGSGGLTPLLGADGFPVITPPSTILPPR